MEKSILIFPLILVYSFTLIAPPVSSYKDTISVLSDWITIRIIFLGYLGVSPFIPNNPTSMKQHQICVSYSHPAGMCVSLLCSAWTWCHGFIRVCYLLLNNTAIYVCDLHPNTFYSKQSHSMHLYKKSYKTIEKTNTKMLW